MTRKFIASCITALLLLSPVTALAESAPKTIGGISLGESINSIESPTYFHFLKEKNIDIDNGFRKATISYGTCVHKDEILRIKMKYTDKSKIFFKDIHEELIDKYGKPDQWEGDSFGILTIWKWHFTDGDNNMVSLSLEYNERDPELSIGTVIKLSYPAKIEEERECDRAIREQPETGSASANDDWDDLLPK